MPSITLRLNGFQFLNLISSCLVLSCLVLSCRILYLIRSYILSYILYLIVSNILSYLISYLIGMAVVYDSLKIPSKYLIIWYCVVLCRNVQCAVCYATYCKFFICLQKRSTRCRNIMLRCRSSARCVTADVRKKFPDVSRHSGRRSKQFCTNPRAAKKRKMLSLRKIQEKKIHLLLCIFCQLYRDYAKEPRMKRKQKPGKETRKTRKHKEYLKR